MKYSVIIFAVLFSVVVTICKSSFYLMLLSKFERLKIIVHNLISNKFLFVI